MVSVFLYAFHLCLTHGSGWHAHLTTKIHNTLLMPRCHSLRCHGFVLHALLLRMHTNVVDFRALRRLCHRDWNWQWNWQSVNQHSWDPRQQTTWSRRVTSDFNSVYWQFGRFFISLVTRPLHIQHVQKSLELGSLSLRKSSSILMKTCCLSSS